jgi:hypothetical protein
MLCDMQLIVLVPTGLLCLLGLLGTSCTGDSGEALERVARKYATYQLTIDPRHRECESDADCIVVSSHCSTCECGAPVNRRFRALYEKRYRDLCREYEGEVCDFYCSTPHSRCIEESCDLSQVTTT